MEYIKNLHPLFFIGVIFMIIGMTEAFRKFTFYKKTDRLSYKYLGIFYLGWIAQGIICILFSLSLYFRIISVKFCNFLMGVGTPVLLILIIPFLVIGILKRDAENKLK